jgi:hypothetical protein
MFPLLLQSNSRAGRAAVPPCSRLLPKPLQQERIGLTLPPRANQSAPHEPQARRGQAIFLPPRACVFICGRCTFLLYHSGMKMQYAQDENLKFVRKIFAFFHKGRLRRAKRLAPQALIFIFILCVFSIFCLTCRPK